MNEAPLFPTFIASVLSCQDCYDRIVHDFTPASERELIADCPNCAGTALEPIPWSEIFMVGRKIDFMEISK